MMNRPMRIKKLTKIIDRSFVTKDADLLGILEAFDGLKDKTLKISDVIEDKVFERVQCRISDYKDSLVDCKTANLWLTYLEMVVLLHRFVRAERTGDWLLHLDTVQRMLPYFAASGHNLYLKSAYIYLSDMLKMRTSHPDIYARFLFGQHVVRRTDRYWTGIWTDLTIEQVLMKSLKSSGGLTRGRGMSEFQRAVWILSSPVCAEFGLAMQNLTGIQYSSSEQHKDSYAPRQARNAKDMKTLSDFLQERDPFQADMKELRNIDNGVTADANVNVDHCLEVGQKIVKSLAGQDAMTHVFKRKHQATTLATKTSVKVDDELISVDPQLMFQRLTTIARETSPDLSEIFKYELSNVPPALFDNSGLAREAHKSQLADAIWTDRDCGTDSLQSCRLFVLDGGSLLHRLSWPQKSTFGEIVQMYTQYVLNKFTNPCVVFDGYESAPSTKDMTHVRRCKGVQSRKTVFNESTVCTSKREAFLANVENKKEFLKLLIRKMREAGCEVLQAEGDADFKLVMTTIRKATSGDVALVGEDTDLLVLLLHHVPLELETNVFFFSDKQMKNFKIWDIKKSKHALGVAVCQSVLVIHEVTGCDTTSRLYGIGKQQALKKVIAQPSFYQEAASVFLQSDLAINTLEQIGEEIMASLYGAHPGEGLDVFRFRKFVSKMSTLEKHLDVQSLPPTSASAKQHLLRVYHQVQQWMGNDLEATDWGWKIYSNNRLQPIKCLLAPAPSNLLKVIRCNCKTNCDSKRCSCRRHGMKCSICCGECRGTSCSNADVEWQDGS